MATRQQPFDRAGRRSARDRCFPVGADAAFIHVHVAGELTARAALAGPGPDGPELRIGLMVPPPPGTVALDPGFAAARAHRGIQADEDRLPIRDASLARLTGLLTFHGVNDLPGALLLARRALMPGGRFLVALPGGFSLGLLRDSFLEADSAAGGVPPRLGPTVDPAEAAGLLQRAGFVEPVVDVETIPVRYRRLADLARDLRAVGDTGWLEARARMPMGRARWAAAEAAFAARAGADGRAMVELQILYLAARAPAAPR